MRCGTIPSRCGTPRVTTSSARTPPSASTRACRFYYYPGFWEAGTQLSLLIGRPHWEALPASYKAVIETVCGDVNGDLTARYAQQNPQVLRRLVGAGTQLKAYSRDILEAAWKATHELYDEFAAKNPKFKKVYEPWKAYRDEQFLWFRVAELTTPTESPLR